MHYLKKMVLRGCRYLIWFVLLYITNYSWLNTCNYLFLEHLPNGLANGLNAKSDSHHKHKHKSKDKDRDKHNDKHRNKEKDRDRDRHSHSHSSSKVMYSIFMHYLKSFIFSFLGVLNSLIFTTGILKKKKSKCHIIKS